MAFLNLRWESTVGGDLQNSWPLNRWPQLKGGHNCVYRLAKLEIYCRTVYFYSQC